MVFQVDGLQDLDVFQCRLCDRAFDAFQIFYAFRVYWRRKAVAKQGLADKQAMRNGQNKRMRGRNRKSHNPLTRVYESNGPDIKIRGTASHVAEKYVQLARDSQSSGDPVAAENYYQHAEHYFRLIAAVQEQFRQNTPNFFRPEGGGNDTHSGNDTHDETFDDGDDEEAGQPMQGTSEQPSFGTRDPQPFLPRDAQFFSPREQQREQQREQHQGGRPQQGGEQHHGGRPQQGGERHHRAPEDGNVDRLPSFITGGGGQPQPPQAQPSMPGNPVPQANGQNGFDNQGERFPMHRRRRRHRGPRSDMPRGAPESGDDAQGPGGE
jgi:uncharacterized protein DUF4167